MKCPLDNTPLEKKLIDDLPMHECPKCHGMWLEVEELDELEDEAWSEDEMKGTVVYETFASQRKCPVCGTTLKGFYYRLHDELQLELCPNKHGYWLDNDENEQILDIMKQEHTENNKAEHSESNWIKHLWRLQSPSAMDKLLSYLPGIKGE